MTTKLTHIIYCLVICFVMSTLANASERETVNVLTWWAYLSHPEIVQEVENKCHIKLSFDEYYSNDEFLRRWEGHKEDYDVIIFSDTIYEVVKDNLPVIKNSKLWLEASNYNPIIRQHYVNERYPHNIAYFVHSVTGFLWNPANIHLEKTDSIRTIFKKAANKHVVIIDDPIEAKKLVEADNSIDLTIDSFKMVTQNANIYITNNYSQIYKKPSFAFSYSWSGEAIIDLMEAKKSYQFMMHPKLSYISTDLLAQTSARAGAACVANYLTGKEALTKIQNIDYYFTPYMNYGDAENKIFRKLYINFYDALPSAKWISTTNQYDFQKINKNWQLIKITQNNRGE